MRATYEVLIFPIPNPVHLEVDSCTRYVEERSLPDEVLLEVSTSYDANESIVEDDD